MFRSKLHTVSIACVALSVLCGRDAASAEYRLEARAGFKTIVETARPDAKAAAPRQQQASAVKINTRTFDLSKLSSADFGDNDAAQR